MPIVLKHKRIPNIFSIKIPPEGLKLNETWSLLSIERLPFDENSCVSETHIIFKFKIRNNASEMESDETRLRYTPSTGNAYTDSGGYSINHPIPPALTNALQILMLTLDIPIHVAVAYHVGCSEHNSEERTRHIFEKKE